MDIDALVAEICRRVQEKLDDCGEVSASVEGTPLPKLLVLTDAHGEECHKTLECRKLAEYYQTECALLKEYDCRIEEYEAVVAYTLTNEALGKIAWGSWTQGIPGCLDRHCWPEKKYSYQKKKWNYTVIGKPLLRRIISGWSRISDCCWTAEW